MTFAQSLVAANANVGAFVEFDEVAQGGKGPLAGLTLGVKANVMVKGFAWTAGMALYRDRVATRDADAVARLRAAGAKVLGTLNMHEAALGAHGDNPFFGTCYNPRKAGYSAGGSSSGSAAAVAAGLCDLALGTDTLGSVRIPAAYCGVYGLKPSWGAVSQDGLACLDPEYDCIGPMAASLDLLEQAWNVLNAAATVPLIFQRLIVLADLGGADVQPAVRAGYETMLARISLPPVEFRTQDDLTAIRRSALAKAGQRLLTDLGDAYRADSADFSAELHFILKACAAMDVQPDVLGRTARSLQAAIGPDGVLMIPTAPQAAFAHGMRPPANQADFTALASIAGLPALAIPSGTDGDGLPVGIQLVGPSGSETSLIEFARELERRGV